MKNFSGVERLAPPFLAGALLAAYCPSLNTLTVCSVAAAFLSAAFLLPDKGLKFTVIYFILGALHYCSVSLCGVPEAPRPAGMAFLADRIMRIRFQHEQTPALLCALLTGSKDMLSPEIREAFRSSGASHVLALSGLHLGVIYLLLEKISRILGRSRPAGIIRSALLCCACIWYALATGASPSVIRATLFVILRECGRHYPGRRLEGGAVFCASLMIQTIANPEVVRSAGFQLSYLAVLGIILLYPRLDALYDAFGRAHGLLRKIWSMMSLSISCQLFTAPLCWKLFGSVPLHFLITNLIAVPLVEILIPSSLFLLLGEALTGGKITETAALFVDRTAVLLTSSLETISNLN